MGGDITSIAQIGHVAHIVGEHKAMTVPMLEDIIRDGECS